MFGRKQHIIYQCQSDIYTVIPPLKKMFILLCFDLCSIIHLSKKTAEFFFVYKLCTTCEKSMKSFIDKSFVKNQLGNWCYTYIL